MDEMLTILKVRTGYQKDAPSMQKSSSRLCQNTYLDVNDDKGELM